MPDRPENQKHTPGPWSITLHKKTEPSAPDRPRHIVAPDGRTVVTFNTQAQIYGDEKRANARLIAAAPELLEALETLLQLTSATPTAPASYYLIPRKDIETAKAAIAKARGEQ